MSSNDELVKRIAALEAELAELKARVPKPEPEFVQREWPRYDPTESFRLPASTAREMARVVPAAKQSKENPMDAWARERRSSPGGFGPKEKPVGEPEVRRTPEAPPLEGMRKGHWSK